MNRILTLLFISLLFCFSVNSVAFPFGNNVDADFTAQADSNEIELGETLRLTITLTAQALSGMPDFSVLKQDFDILEGPNQQNVFRSTNGKSDSKTTWQLTLQPKSVGALVIPPIQYKNLKTDPIVINVKKQTTAKRSKNDQIFYEATLDHDQVYVQSQLILTLRLYTEVSLLDNKFGEVNIPGAIIQQLGDPRTFTVQRGNRNYKVAEVKFAVFPQASGELKIPPMNFDAVVELQGTQDQFFMFGGPDTKRLLLKSEELIVKVAPKPQSYPANAVWLPAKKLELTEHWSGDTDKAKVGEPLTRTLAINALGQPSSALPNFQIEKNDAYKIYPDKAQTEDKNTAQGVEGMHKEALAIVPTTSGAITLPATKFYWWNTETDKLEVAELHSKTLMVSGDASTKPSNTPVTPPSSSVETETRSELPLPNLVVTPQPPSRIILWQIASGIFALLWVITLMLYLKARKNNALENRPIEEDPNAKVQKQIVTLKHLREDAIAACHRHHAAGARDAIIKYVAALLPGQKIHSLGDIKRHVADAGVVSSIDELETILYKKDNQEWDGATLAKAIGQLKLAKVNKALPKPILEALYPV